MIACVRLPHFAASLEERAHPDLRGKPFVLVAHGERVAGMSPQAARAGVRAGMNVTRARAQCGDLLIRATVASQYQQAFGDLLAALTTFTAQVEAEDGLELRADGRSSRHVPFLPLAQFDDYPAATCYLDLGKLKPDELPPLARELGRFVWEQTHIPARLGLSSGKFPARVAATSVNNGDVLVVPGGRETDFLAGFTVALLPVDGETLRQLDLLGWHTLGDVAVQPVSALFARFGKQGRIMHRLANGRDTSPVLAYEPPRSERASRELDGAVTDWGRLDAVLDDMLASMAGSLFDAGQSVRQITLTLRLEDGTPLEQQVVLRQPSNRLPHIREAVREMAQSLVVTCGVVAIDLSLSDIAPAVARQLSLFDRPTVSQAHLSTVLHDMVARYGDTHFYWVRAVARDARLPERRYRWEKADGS